MPEGDAPAAADRWRLAFPVAIVLVLVPFLVAIVVTLLDGGHTPISDRALMELRVRDVGVHPVTIGLYSRDGWAHPGPFVDYLLVVPYRLLGSDMNALMVGSLLLNGFAVATIGAIAKRVGGLGAALVMLVAASAVARALGMELLTDPWVCWITVLPFGMFCLLTWAMADGRVWSLPLAAVAASFLMQTHVGFVPIVLPALGVGAIWLVVRVVRTTPSRGRELVGAGLVTLGATALVWAPPLWDEWRGIGNLSAIVRWFRDNTEATHTITEATRIVGGQFSIVPDWVTGTRRVGVGGATTLLHTTLTPVLLLPFALACVVVVVRRDRVARALLVMLGITGVAGVIAVARTTGQMYDYRLLWTWMLGALVTAATVFALWRWLRVHLPAGTRPVVVGLLFATLLGLSVAQTADALDADRPYAWDSPVTARAVAQAESHLHRGAGELVLTSETYVGNWYVQGILLAFEHDGFDARVDHDIADTFGSARVRDKRAPVQAELLVLAGSEIMGYRGRPGFHVIGYGGRRSLAATLAAGRRFEARRQHLTDLEQQGRISKETFARRLVSLPQGPVAVLILRRDT